LRREGLKVGLLRLKTLWPFPEEAVREVGRKMRAIVVPEMNQGQVAGEVRKYCSCEVVPLGQTNGEVIKPETIIEVLKKFN
jgi:2-oxoglutarate ferredoxin oxidoreductase subunit alpha